MHKNAPILHLFSHFDDNLWHLQKLVYHIEVLSKISFGHFHELYELK